MEVSFEDFKKMDIRVGKIIKVEEPEGSKTMLKMTVDFGNEQRIAMAGLKNYYKPEDFIDKKFVFILNLERKKFLGIESECMILAADNEKGDVVLIRPEKEIEVGSRIR
ncbi:MAG: methionine--tRNA ligase [Candidatus Aenigmarchaeota archaeon]|nr:methionine--tRNA ligase [Candidatus Aenigmarchaeota archaeon]